MNYYDGKKILITGAAGFIGSHLVDQLLKYEVKRIIGLDNLIAGKKINLSEAEKDSRFEFVLGDITDGMLINQLSAEVDIIFHLAASKLVVSRNNPFIDLHTNIMGTFNILSAARGRNIKIIYASTGSVLGSAEQPMAENHIKKPTTLYGISKGTAEEYCLFFCREFGVKTTIIRYFHVYGPRQDYDGPAGVISIFLARAMRGLPLYVHGSGEQIRCFTFVLDDVAATLFLGEHDETIGQIFHVASPVRLSVINLAKIIKDKYGGEIIHTEARPGENLRPIPDTAKIEKLGFKVNTDFEVGLELTANWVKNDLQNRGLIK